MTRTGLTLVCVTLGTRFAFAQPEPAQPTNPPPASPPPNWAPPQPQPPPAAETPTETASPPQNAAPAPVVAESVAEPPGRSFEIYGFAMLDIGYDFGQIGDPTWQDALRPTKLPAFDDEFGKGGRTFAGVRQTPVRREGDDPDRRTATSRRRSSSSCSAPASTRARRRSGCVTPYGDWKALRAGQTWSPFMDIDVFPNSIEYWGPNGMVFFRNVQLAWMPIQRRLARDDRARAARVRAPDTGIYADRIELDERRAAVPRARPLGGRRATAARGATSRLPGILRYIKWDDLDPTSTRSRRSRRGAGACTSARTSSSTRRVLRLQARLRRGDRELHERRRRRRRCRS